MEDNELSDVDPDEVLEDNEDETTETEPAVAVQRRPRHSKSAVGAIMTGIAKGLQFVFDPKEPEEIPIVQKANDPDRDEDGPYSVSLDADKPGSTVIRFKPKDENTAANDGPADA